MGSHRRPGWRGRHRNDQIDLSGADLTRDCFLENILGAGQFDIDGFTLDFGAEDNRAVDNQGSDAVFLTVIDANGSYRPEASMGEVNP